MSIWFRKIITRELQEWHKQQVSKYKTLTVAPTVQAEAIDERLPSLPPPPVPSEGEEQRDSMITSALPSSEDSRTICSSSFIVTGEPSLVSSVMARSLSITHTNDDPITPDRSRFELHWSFVFCFALKRSQVRCSISSTEVWNRVLTCAVGCRVWQATHETIPSS